MCSRFVLKWASIRLKSQDKKDRLTYASLSYTSVTRIHYLLFLIKSLLTDEPTWYCAPPTSVCKKTAFLSTDQSNEREANKKETGSHISILMNASSCVFLISSFAKSAYNLFLALELRDVSIWLKRSVSNDWALPRELKSSTYDACWLISKQIMAAKLTLELNYYRHRQHQLVL